MPSMASPSTAGGPRAAHTARVPRSVYDAVAVASLAAALGYLLHHLPPLREHPVDGVVLALALASTVAFALGRLIAERRPHELPAVVVAAQGAPGVRPLTRADLAFCAALHAQALPHGFFAELGPRFLRAYYATFLDSPHAVAFAATASGEPVGYLVGVVSPRGHARWVLRRRGPTLALYGLFGMALHPRAAYRFARTRVGRYARVWRRHRGTDEPQPAVGAAPAVLTHLAVVPGARRIAAGSTLVATFEDAAREHGATRALLTTLEGPDGAGGFYRRLGWSRSATRPTADGILMEEWEKALDRPQGS